MGQKYRRKLESKNGKQTVKRKEATGEGEVVPGQQKRKKKRLIGVVKVRFYPPKDTDVASLILALDAIEDNTVAAAREKVYKEHREAVQHIFNMSSDMKTCITGFFDDPLHCRTHAEYLAERSVLEAVESDFSNLFDDVQSVMNVWAKTEASKQRMEAAHLRCLELQAGFRIRVQYFRLNSDPDPDPGFDDQKLKEKLQLEKICTCFLDQKLQFTYPQASIKDVQVAEEAFSTKIFFFCGSFWPSWIRIRIPNTDPDPLT
jgi:hypothetical protein